MFASIVFCLKQPEAGWEVGASSGAVRRAKTRNRVSQTKKATVPCY